MEFDARKLEGGLRSTKSTEAARRIDAMARVLGPGGRLPPVRQLCHDLGISLATLNTAMQILEAKRVIERKHGSGIYVTEHIAVPRVGVLLNTGLFLTGGAPSWGVFLRNLLDRISASGLHPVIYLRPPGDDSDREGVLPWDFEYALHQGRVDAVVAVGIELAAIVELEKRGFSVVSFAGPGAICFEIDTENCIQLVAAELVKGGAKTARIAGCHFEGHYEVCERGAIAGGFTLFPGEKMHWHDQQMLDRLGRPLIHQGQEFAEEFLESCREGEIPDVLFLMDDNFAHGFLMVWQGLDDRPDVHIAAHSNREVRLHPGFCQEISRIEFSVEVLAKLMAEAVVFVHEGGRSFEKFLAKRGVSENLYFGVEDGRTIVNLVGEAIVGKSGL